MRVAYLINQYPGLSHSFIRREVQALERRGLDVRRYAVRPAGQGQLSPEDEEEAARTEVLTATPKGTLLRDALAGAMRRPGRTLKALGLALRLGARSDVGLVRHVLYWGEALVVARWLTRDGAEHLHAHFGTNPATIAMLASSLTGVPYSLTVHGPEEFDRPRALGLPEKIERSAFTAGVSSYGVSQLRRLVTPDHWDRIRQVRCGVEPGFAAETASDESQADFVSVGRLSEQKGQVTLIEAAGRLKAQGRTFRLDLIGDGELRGLIEATIRAHGVENEVRLLGWRTPREVADALAGCRCFVLPSYAEGLPVSIMEAFFARRPVISTYIAGIPELVRAGENGWLVPAADADALAEAMAAALDASPERLAEMGQAGHDRAAARHGIDHVIEPLIEGFR